MTALPPMADGIPGRQHLTGYRLHGHDDALHRLALIREDRDITLGRLAHRIGCSAQTLGQNLRGQHRMDARHLFAAYDALGYDLALIPREDT